MRRVPSFLLFALPFAIACGEKDDTALEPTDADADGSTADEDCDDTDPAVHPGADELCNGADDDCDGDTDEGDAVDAATWHTDADRDGYGSIGAGMTACQQPPDAVADGSDCDDTDEGVHPHAEETCDGVDQDCDDEVDDDAIDAPTWYMDYDEDGYGGTAHVETTCEQPSGYVENADDCDDTEPAAFPGADEDPCNGVDDDCDTEIDEHDGPSAVWYLDTDSDGYGDTTQVQERHASCTGPTGYSPLGGDCDDTDPDLNPGAAEYCDGIDNDCDASTDEDDAVDVLPWYEDADGDGYGWFYDPPTLACDPPSGFVADDTDCDDTDPAVNPTSGDPCNWATIPDVQGGVWVVGDTVHVVGLAAHDATGTGFDLLDPAGGAYSGVWIYATGTGVSEGDELLVRGTVAEFYELTELSVAAPASDLLVLSTGNALPAASLLSTSTLADPLTAEPWEGCLVTVTYATVDDPDLGYGEWSIDDDVVIDNLIYTWPDPLDVGGTFDSITGLLYYNYGNYKIEPRWAADLVNYVEPPCAADACHGDLVVGDLVITEIMYNSEWCADDACEWIEVYNASGGSVDLNGLRIVDDSGNVASVTDTPIQAAGSWVVLAVGDSSTWGYVGFSPDGYYGTTVALGNNGDQVFLQNSAGTLEASPAWTSGITSAGESWSLDPTAIDVISNDDTLNWCAAITAIGATGDFGTPGASNDSCF